MDATLTRLEALGLELPPVVPLLATTCRCHRWATSSTSGDSPTSAEGREAARSTALSILPTPNAEFGGLYPVTRIVKVFGMVNVAPEFTQTFAVIDGCSDLLVDVFGEAGRHTRTAVGLAELLFAMAVEIELIAETG